jgi:tetratricopeptide (TPR) repeat protein
MCFSLGAALSLPALHAQTAPPADSAQAPATQQTPAEPLTPERRGDIYMARKMYREALETYRQAPQNSAVVWNKMGIAYQQLTQLDTARKHYERSLKLNPKYAEAINNLGTVHYAKKNYRRAVSQYQRALKITPNSASILSNLGMAYFARKRYEQAAETFRQALAIDPDVFEHRSTYGVLLQERSVEERAKFHYYLAKLYAQGGRTEEALQYIRKALEEGFKDRKKFLEEPEFTALRELPQFKELMSLEPRVL